ncbi:MAG: hypothetical protein QG574_4486, partial [Cyanobacteriota bacterium erpe_2018_sw_21hr_WHONDRS-SW48-000092_B_bin.40]|nr:hypothetical protein [Cyanobacteriota bacterium erpe_2018_sw_21hr_WHONDRS-SW48-000092_B_bin.40]MDQ5937127.1 hypothetical protein [Cyanobacteriota bacterium erpe_2018_sw_21hr_WHONDRS-SW48-000092_B_bin.40]
MAYLRVVLMPSLKSDGEMSFLVVHSLCS